jgi:hypothetical protein
MSLLGSKQEEFTILIARLILWGNAQGYKMHLGEGFNAAGIGHKKNSNHYLKLAQDIFIYKNGVDEQDEEAHQRMHDAWDQMEGAPRILNDLNHYSVVWEGRW